MVVGERARDDAPWSSRAMILPPLGERSGRVIHLPTTVTYVLYNTYDIVSEGGVNVARNIGCSEFCNLPPAHHHHHQNNGSMTYYSQHMALNARNVRYE